MVEDHIAKARRIAAATKPRFVDIPREPRVRFFTAHDNAKKRWAAEADAKTTAVLQAEHDRLVKTWRKP